ncbi:hypothetical protein [Pseudarthrobacter polychromogenes]|uniref:Uncharacterized protein n=1 Tax=Pseudarthrobacter polychromogenes TaxID=1676 RepID=A0ABQ1XC36_9MICC|nr:hypothetical protein [Pseudarthrobacter polychromogenes]GGG83751.1 hypothetical protein GCM10011577_01500 [Pseudarthrobacter polychromogenes]
MQDTKFLTEEWFWAAVAAVVGSAAIIGAFFSWLTAVIIRHREQPEADWAVMMHGYATEEDVPGVNEAGVHLSGRISNAGDGGAFRVRLESRNCKAGFTPADTQGMVAKSFMPPGADLSFWIEMDLDSWNDAEVDIVWTAPPTRLRKEMRSPLNPKDFMDPPGVPFTDPDTGVVSERPVTTLSAGS